MKHLDNLILASNSPRRKHLLSEAGFQFEVKTIPFEEIIPKNVALDEVAAYLAIQKNDAHRKVFQKETIITADTVVIFDNKIYGKPKTIENAKNTLHLLSGKIHHVITGVCISNLEKKISFSNLTEVKFRNLTKEEIDFYTKKSPPLDKAGSYGIQDWIGLIGVEWVKGSFYNVIGLPIDQVYKLLNEEF